MNEGVEVQPVPQANEHRERRASSLRVRKLNTLGSAQMKDHFSLSNPSSIVSFTDEESVVFIDNLEQVTLQKKKGDDYIVAKQATVASPGLMFMRMAYAIIATLMAGFLLVFCIQIVLFLFLGLAIESGE